MVLGQRLRFLLPVLDRCALGSRALGVASVLSVAGFPVFSQPFTGNDVYHSCRAEGDLLEQGFCMGYILGAVEGMKWGGLLGVLRMSQSAFEVDEYDVISSIAVGFCIPSRVDNRQVLDTVIAYMRDNPTTRHESARSQIQEALRLGFPCE